MMSKTRQRQLRTGDPLNIPDPLTLFPDPMRRPGGDERPLSVSGMMSSASIAASVSAQGGTEPAVTVMPPVPNGPIGNGNASASGPSVDSASTKPNATLTPTVTHCENCGDAFTPRRPHGRFCCAYCRRVAWLGRNPDKAAELAERDRQRLREHIIGGGGEWVERCHDGA